MLSTSKKLQIANICYANVSSSFAMFCNPKYRGANFQWDKFKDMMVRMSDTWLMIHIPKVTPEMQELAKQYAEEIASNMLDQSGFVDS
jgi:hypothetical protein